MSENESAPREDDGGSRRSLGRDALGLVLFAFAVLVGVSVFMAMTQPAESPDGSTAMFTLLVDSLGPWPLLVFAFALAFLVLAARAALAARRVRILERSGDPAGRS